MSLLELATGSVQQEVTFSERDGRTTIESYRLNFHVHFQENFAFVMRLTDWSGSKLRSTDETGSSDPFLRFFIRGSRQKRYKNWYAHQAHAAHNNPALHPTHTYLPSHTSFTLHSPRHRYKRGGLMGRSTSTDVQYNTLNPDNMNAKRPLYYYGTRSDLENETLRIEVWDWDPTSANDLIGFAEVPLRGILLSGRISTGLAMYAAGGGGDLMTAGSLQGSLEMLAEPTHTQFGDVVKRLPKMTYLALNVQVLYSRKQQHPPFPLLPTITSLPPPPTHPSAVVHRPHW